MSGVREDIPVTASKSNKSVKQPKAGFSFDAMQSLWDSIESCEHVISARLPTDICSEQYAEHFGVSINSARCKMKQLAKQYPDTWALVRVLDNGHRRNVLRKVNKE